MTKRPSSKTGGVRECFAGRQSSKVHVLYFYASPHNSRMYCPLCLLQAITFLEPLHGCAETDTPDVCRQLAECHLKNGDPAAAVTVYESIVDSESTGGMRIAAQRRTALLLPAIDGKPCCSARGLVHMCVCS